MKTKIHLPRTVDDRDVRIETELPVVFLAGPIKNAPKWREDIIRLFIQKNEPIFIASPTVELPTILYIQKEREAEDCEFFLHQGSWVQYYANKAAASGVILFWLPGANSEKDDSEKNYGHMTMFELGKWMNEAKHNPEINLIIGTDGNFPEWKIIKRELEAGLPDLEICSSIEEMVTKTLELVTLVKIPS